MTLIKCFFVLAIALFWATLKNTSCTSIKAYIEEKLKETEQVLAKVHSQYGDMLIIVDEDNYEENWEELWSDTYSKSKIIQISNRLFIINENQAFSFPVNENSSGNITVDGTFDNPLFPDPIEFFKVTSWNESLFLLPCQSNYCILYYGSMESLRLETRQIMRHNDLLPKNARFFTKDNNLFLIIHFANSSNSTNNSTVFKIYKWLGTTFDLIKKLETPRVKALTTVQDEQSVLILLAFDDYQTDGLINNISAIIYELDDQNNLKFIKALTNFGLINSVYTYDNEDEEFVILIGNKRSSGIYQWDGIELNQWAQIPNIESVDLIKTVHYDNEILLFLYSENNLSIYKISKWILIKLHELSLKNERVIGIFGEAKENSVVLASTKSTHNGAYQFQLRKLIQHKGEVEKIQNSFNELKNLLKAAIINSEESRKYRSKLNFVPHDTEYLPLELSNVFIDDKNLPSLTFDSPDENLTPDIISIQSSMKNIESRVDEILEVSKNLQLQENSSSFLDNVLVNGNVYFDELYINNLKVQDLNGEKIDFDKVLITETSQNFSAPLQAKNIYIENLEIGSLCGLESNYWAQVDDVDRTNLKNLDLNKTFIYNNTISVKTDLILNTVNVNKINNISLSTFTEDSFVIGKRQFIEGNITFENLLHVTKFSANKINDVPSSMLITKHTNQTLEDVFVDVLEVDNLHVKTINGVPVDKAARKSQENVIKGMVTLRDFVITDELVVQEDMMLPFTRPSQIYDEITIDGNVFVKNLEFEADASLSLVTDEVLVDYNVQDIIKNSWSKSGDQVIANPVHFQKGASIDKLECQYLNGFAETDFLYVNSTEISDLDNVIFADFYFNSVINDDIGFPARLLDQYSNVLTVHDTVHINHLSVANLITDNYNGISLKYIMEAKNFSKFLEPLEFETMYVDNRMAVDHLIIDPLSIDNVNFEKGLKANEDLQIDVLKLNNLNVRSIIINKLFGKDFHSALLSQNIISNRPNVKSLTVDGEMQVKNNLYVEKINKEDTDDFVYNLKSIDLTDLIDLRDIKNLRIIKNLNVTSLNEQSVRDYFENSLTKSGRQNILGDVESLSAHVNYLKTNVINKKNVSDLVYVDEPCILKANVSFSELIVRGKVTSKTVENEPITKVLKKLHVLPLDKVKSLTVLGKVGWNKPSKNPYSLNNLLANAVTKNDNQTLDHLVTFAKPVSIDSLQIENTNCSVVQQIRKVITDTVMDYDDKKVIIQGKKTFKNQLSVDSFEVVNNINVKNVNGLDMEETIVKIFQNYDSHDNSTFNNLIFLKEVEIGTLITDKKIHGVAFDQLGTYKKRLPDNVHFEHLTILQDVTVGELDGRDFDDFVKNRLTVRGNHHVYSNMEFKDLVYVQNKTVTSLINNIKVTNLVTTDKADNVPIMIYGKKTFKSKLIVDGNVEASTINNLDLKKIFSNETVLMTYDDESGVVEIFGSLVFENKVETSNSNMDVLGQINGEEYKNVFRVQSFEKSLAMQASEKNETLIDNLMSNLSSNMPGAYVDSLLYLEQDDALNLHLPGVRRVKSTRVGSTTQLDIYTTEVCENDSSCNCQSKHVVEVSDGNNYKIKEIIESNVIFNFRETNGLFELKILGEQCSYKSNNTTNFKIVWVESNGTEYELFQVDNYITDAQMFVYKDKVYLILAIFYDKAVNSYTAKSLVYEIDVTNKNTSLVRYFLTDGAKAVHIFVMDYHVYAIIGCIKGKAESILLKFDPKVPQFQLVRTFATGGSKYINSANCNGKFFLILSNPDIEALQIFVYNRLLNDFLDYQNLYLGSKTTSLNVLSSKDFGGTETFIITTTKDGWLYVYEYMYFGKFQRKISYWTEEIQVLTPFSILNQHYLFAGSKLNSTILKIIQQGLY